MEEIFLTIALLSLYLAVICSIVAGIIWLLFFFNNKQAFLMILKPALVAGFFSIIFILALGLFYDSATANIFIVPAALVCAGLISGTIKAYRSNQAKL